MEKKKRDHLQKALGKNLASYILITCENPSSTGEMPIEMTYHGEEALVSYLLHQAQMHLEENEEESLCSSADTIRLVE